MGSRDNSGRRSKVEVEGTSARAQEQQEKVKKASSKTWTWMLAETLYLPTAATVTARKMLPALLAAALIVGRIVKGAVYPRDWLPKFHGTGDNAPKAAVLQEVLWRTNPFKKVKPSLNVDARKFDKVPEKPSLAAALIVQQIHPAYPEDEGWVNDMAEWYVTTALPNIDNRGEELWPTMLLNGRLRFHDIAEWFAADRTRLVKDLPSLTTSCSIARQKSQAAPRR